MDNFTIPEEFLILIIDEEKNNFSIKENRFINLSLSGGILLELILTGRLSILKNELILVDETPIENEILNKALDIIKDDGQIHSPLAWIRKLIEELGDIRQIFVNKLEKDGFVQTFTKRALFIFPVEQIKLDDPKIQKMIKERLRTCITSKKESSPRTLALVSLISASNSAYTIFTQNELETYLDTVRSLVASENIGKSVEQSIQDLTDALLRTYINSVYIY
jgi:hypothetical protein